MEIHEPRKPIRSWRDFLKEVGIIVLGVLIALSAEQLVDAVHWRDKIAAAEDAMRLELSEDDGPQAYARVVVARCFDDALARMDSTAAHGANPHALDEMVGAYDPPIRTWDDEAWKAVVASDVGTHMNAARLVAWSAPYRLMPKTNELNQEETSYATDLRRSVTSPATPAQVTGFRRGVAQLRRLNGEIATMSRVVLGRMHALGVDVPPAERRALLAEATRRYGKCAIEPGLVPESTLSQFSGSAEERVFGLGIDPTPRDTTP